MQKKGTQSLALFCKVVDNYGDIGICWRLARQLQNEHAVDVTLWVDDLRSFRRICPEVDVESELQQIAGVSVRHWRDQQGIFNAGDVADIVIEFFGCDLPPGYVTAMAQRRPQPIWLNLEGLTAEEWVEGCHRLPSMHPQLPLTKHFFFPGFTEKTGGLLCEAGLGAERSQFRRDPAAVATFLMQFGVTPDEMASLKISLFCYPHAPVAALFDTWRRGSTAITCLVPEGVAKEAVQDFLQADALAGATRQQGALRLRVLPFVPQPDYDKLLWACDLNFVRGEDSFARAQWASRPFIWHIYPQDENLHHKKLRAFLQRYAPDIAGLRDFLLHWNGAAGEPADWPQLWSALHADMARMADRAAEWEQGMLQNGDLAANLLEFATQLRSEAGKNHV